MVWMFVLVYYKQADSAPQEGRAGSGGLRLVAAGVCTAERSCVHARQSTFTFGHTYCINADLLRNLQKDPYKRKGHLASTRSLFALARGGGRSINAPAEGMDPQNVN
ncbi:hypothetical protein EVAR_84124_1 [Eumeta japonica]|uniref:Uncharacterized protein n=1 Tax=Eumeta variegata TaxID=151549 RepID=A0A4C1UYY8_EUMVA|nr:hypothetical protein EVAR_84124_1 [Eumeta japonica]